MIRTICVVLALISLFQPEADAVNAIVWTLMAIFFQLYKNGRKV